MKISRLRFAILFFALSAAQVFGTEMNEMVLRCYPFQLPSYEFKRDDSGTNAVASGTGGGSFAGIYEGVPETSAVSNFVELLGVKSPTGSYIRIERNFSRLCMFNTEANQEKLNEVLGSIIDRPYSVELDASFIGFDLKEIEDVARKNLSAAPTMVQIAELWRSGKGSLLGTHKVITRSGVNAQSQGVDEQIYATEFVTGAQTNGPKKKAPSSPMSFETREVGMIFNITPTVGPDGYTIDLVLAPELSDGDVWDDITTTISRGENNEENLIVRQPRFHTARMTTTVALDDGATFIQGGMASRDGQSLNYFFLTARIIGTDGKPVHPDAKPKIQEATPKAK